MRYAGETELFPPVWGQIADRLCPPDRGLASLAKAEQGRSQKTVDKAKATASKAAGSVDKVIEVRI